MSEESTSIMSESRRREGLLTATITAEFPENIKFHASEHEWILNDEGKKSLVLKHSNSYVRLGLRNSLNLEFGLGGTAVGYIGIDSDTSAVTYNTVYLHGTAAGTSTATTIIKAFSPAASIVTDGSNVVQVVTAGATFANADFTNSVFTINKVGFLNTSTDAGTGLIDVIGGTGSTPYSRAFSLNLASAGTFSFVLQIAVTAPVATTG
jgi:hypothetical protein